MAVSRRTEMTKLLFRTALIELMQEKPFHKITVKEICEQADLNRTTFYLHYSDQTQLLNDIVAKLEIDTAEHFTSVTGTGNDIDLLSKHLEYIKDNAKIYRTESPYVYKFITFGCGSVISQWIDNGFDLETREMANLLYNLCKKAGKVQIS